MSFLLQLTCLLLACSEPPNVVVILADDLGFGDIGAYNDESGVPTPNLDRIAARGMAFLDAHSPSAVCTPTRYGLLTGRYAWRTRLHRWVLNGSSPMLIERDRHTIASVLSRSGYATRGVGKWHLGLGTVQPTDYAAPFDAGPLSIGFEHFEGVPASLDMEPYAWIIDETIESPLAVELPASQHRRKGGGGFWRKGRASAEFDMDDVLPRIGRTACRMIDEMAQEDRPFFLYVPLTAPHTPWLPDAAHSGASTAGYYGDFVAMVDSVVGRSVPCLADAGVEKDTLLVFTSDNGAHWPLSDVERFSHAANLDWRGQKADIHEGGHRVPFLVVWPGHVPAGSTSGETVCLTDIFPTVLGAAGIELPDGAAPDGINLVSILEASGQPTETRDGIVHHSGDGMFAIRKGRWKLIEGRGSGGFTAPARRKELPEGEPSVQLYDLASDPGESRNLANDMPEKVEELQGLLDAIRSGDGSVSRRNPAGS